MTQLPKPGRRQFLRSASALGAVVTAVPALGATSASMATRAGPPSRPVQGVGTELLLLGTSAGPVPMAGRTGIASALVVDGRVYLVDFGHGAFDQFGRAGLSPADLANIYITHLHSDHLADLYGLLWLRFGGINPITQPVDIYGPGPAGALPQASSGQAVGTVNPENPTPGLTDFITTSMAASAYDLNLRMRDEGWPDVRNLVRTHEIQLPDIDAGPDPKYGPTNGTFPRDGR